jgi:GDSL-like Lipase/Acylhydrolase family
MSGPQTFPAASSKRKYFVLVLCTLVLSYLILEGMALAGLAVLSSWKRIAYEPMALALTAEQRALITDRLKTYKNTGSLGPHHPVLGWTPVKGEVSPDRMIVFNAQAVRSRKEFSPQPVDGLVRIAAFGDSFTLGAGVADQDTWEEQVSRSGKGIEVLNFGVGGYGFDQAYLRYLHEGKTYRPDIVVLGFMSENIFRNVNVFRPFYNNAYAGNLLPKPRFLLNGERLVLQENPVKTAADLQRLLDEDRQVLSEFGKNDYHYQKRYPQGTFDFLPSVRLGKIVVQRLGEMAREDVITPDGSYNTRSEAFKVTDRIFEKFYRAALMNGSLPVILVYPDRPDIKAFPQRQTSRYQPLLKSFESKQYRFIDLMRAFTQHDPALDWKKLSVDGWGHYSPLGHKITAEHLLKYLDEQGLTSREAISRKVIEERNRLAL